jgi:hypothetical protein
MGLNPAVCIEWQETNHLVLGAIKMPLASGRWNDNISVEWFVLSTSYLISNGNEKVPTLVLFYG